VYLWVGVAIGTYFNQYFNILINNFVKCCMYNCSLFQRAQCKLAI